MDPQNPVTSEATALAAAEGLGEYIAEAQVGDLSAQTVDITKGLIMKTMAGIVAGSREPIGRIVASHIQAQGGAPDAGFVAGGFRTSVENAAFAFGTFAHASELEDDEPGVVGDFWIFPALFPLAEKLNASGRDLISATAVSYEVTARLALAAPIKQFRKRAGIICGTWFGVIGAAAGAAKLLKLSADQALNAIAIAASHSSGLYASVGTDAHFLESGHSCRSGVLSALMAREGATGSKLFFHGRRGMLHPVHADNVTDLAILTRNLGLEPFKVRDIWVKKYPCCFDTHIPIEILTNLMDEKQIRYEDIESIEAQIDGHAQSVVDRHATDLVNTRFSLYYILAKVMLNGRIDITDFNHPEGMMDPSVLEAQDKVTITVPDGWETASSMQNGATLIVRLKNGVVLKRHLDQPTGGTGARLSLKQIAAISRPYLEMAMNGGCLERVEEILVTLERQPDVRELMNLVTFSRGGF